MRKLSSLVLYGVPLLLSIGLLAPAYAGTPATNEYKGGDFLADEGSTSTTVTQDITHPGEVSADGSHAPHKTSAESKASTNIFSRRTYPQPPEQEATAFAIVYQRWNWYSSNNTPAPAFGAKVEGHYSGSMSSDVHDADYIVEAEFDIDSPRGAIAAYSLVDHPNPHTIPRTSFVASVLNDDGNSKFQDGAVLRHSVSVRSHCKINILRLPGDENAQVFKETSGLNEIQPDKFVVAVFPARQEQGI